MARILLADDEPNMLELLKLILGPKHTYLEAEDGERALKLARQHKPDIMLLDVMMPKKNGYEVCEVMKQDRSLKKIPIIMLSAKAQERDIIEGLKLGAEKYVTKPFDPKKLELEVRELLR
jgi:DNA-binding response OmpR family regulator